MFRVVYSRRAESALEQFDAVTAHRIVAALSEVSVNPFFGKDVKKLRGELTGKYRLRVGRIRMVYTVLEQERAVRIDDIAHRGRAY